MAGGGASNCDGATRAGFSFARGNSNFCSCGVESFFFSDFLPAAMALQSGQGCWPSKVRDTAWLTEPQLKFSASIVVQATDCSKAQCAPVVATSVAIITILAKRANTVTLKWNIRGRMSNSVLDGARECGR